MIEERAQTMEKDLESTNAELKAAKEENIEYKYENRQLKEDMDAINQVHIHSHRLFISFLLLE